ncbi:hypothetical protein ACFYWO_38045 [Streptomyces sp. NPDC002932]|uniref:hypothetical protein n=1 Tax=Streptomyces sp. NPDC002932 TaxID=3364672 RepID=UPI0036C8112F
MTSTTARHTNRVVLQGPVDANAHCHSADREHMIVSTLAPQAGGIDDIRREDDAKGFERDETDQFHQLVRQLAAEGDLRASSAGRRARRTFKEMAPGQTRQPVLRMTRPLTFTSSVSRAGADDACGICGFWTCRCGAVVPAPALSTRAVS